jgi:hypothetical protein
VHREYIYPTSSGTIQLNISGFNNYRWFSINAERVTNKTMNLDQ